MWQTMFVDMKSLLSWQYLMRDIHIIKTWNITMVTSQEILYKGEMPETVADFGFSLIIHYIRRKYDILLMICLIRSTALS